MVEILALVACLRTDAAVLLVGGCQPTPVYQALLEEVQRSGHPVLTVGPEGPGAVAASPGPAHRPRSPIGPGSLLLAFEGSTGRPKLVVDRASAPPDGAPGSGSSCAARCTTRRA